MLQYSHLPKHGHCLQQLIGWQILCDKSNNSNHFWMIQSGLFFSYYSEFWKCVSNHFECLVLRNWQQFSSWFYKFNVLTITVWPRCYCCAPRPKNMVPVFNSCSVGTSYVTEVIISEWLLLRSWDSAVGITTGYRLDPRGWSLSTGTGKIFPLSMFSRPVQGSTQPPIQWVLLTLSLGVKQPGHETDHKPPTNAVKNMSSKHPLPHTYSWRSA
jgi:hypothetical protein